MTQSRLTPAGTAAARAAAEATQYQVSITMSDDTVRQLLKDQYSLFGFKAVKSTIGSGAPLVWFKSPDYSTSTVLTWLEQYEAYTSKSEIIPNGSIVASFSAPITLGQTLVVDDAAGTGSVMEQGSPVAISIQNTVTTPFTCGISQVVNNQASPLCAFPLHGLQEDVMIPIEKILLMFATEQVNTGTVIEKAYSSGLLIDLTGAPQNQRSVSFDIDKGWDWGGLSWGQQVSANENLAPILIQQ